MTFKSIFFGAALITAASFAFAGGFGLDIGKPSGIPEAEAKHALFVVRGIGCVKPETVTFIASAVGLVNGKRQDVALKLIALETPGLYALTRQWPERGTWVITVIASIPNFDGHRSAIVKVNGDSVDWAGITRLMQAPTPQQVDEALSSTTTARLQPQ